LPARPWSGSLNAMEASAQRGDSMRDAGHELARFWWIWLVAGLAWLGIAYVVLQFDDASVKTVGVLVGIMFLLSGSQQLGVSALVGQGRLLHVTFGLLFTAAGFVALFNPEDTFAGIADILGFLFLLVGAFWMIGAFASRAANEFWWLGLLNGILMLILAFWTSGQFYTEKAYTLLVFAGIWALMHGTTDLVRAFQIRGLRGEG
jgi:uncharacterized membrane protein HdeD (DUF308 family)